MRPSPYDSADYVIWEADCGISFLLKVQAARDEMQWGEEGPPPLLVKIAPDLSKEDLEDIAAVSIHVLVYFLQSLSSLMVYKVLILYS